MPAFLQRLPVDQSSFNSTITSSFRPVRASQTRTALVLVSDFSPELHPALHFAAAFCPEVIAIHVSVDAAKTRSIQNRWFICGATAPLVVLDADNEAHLDPLAAYIDSLGVADQDEVMVVIPEKEPVIAANRSGSQELSLSELNRDYCPVTGLPRVPAG